jgi:uncharacterized protein
MPDLKILLALPGIIMGALAIFLCIWLRLPLPWPGFEVLILAFVACYFFLRWLTVLFEPLAAFQATSGLLDGILRQLKLTPWWALLLSITSSVGEELFFRGFLLSLFGQWWPVWLALLVQALLFAAMHPAPRRAWLYPVWAFGGGIIFGAIALASGSVWPGVLAHYVFNHENFNQALLELSKERRI